MLLQDNTIHTCRVLFIIVHTEHEHKHKCITHFAVVGCYLILYAIRLMYNTVVWVWDSYYSRNANVTNDKSTQIVRPNSKQPNTTCNIEIELMEILKRV